MNRDYKLFLQDILDACHHVEAFVRNMRFDEFLLDEKTSSAVIRKLEIIAKLPRISLWISAMRIPTLNGRILQGCEIV
ncbi:MAG: hypothetical protein ONB46_07955 [candidate division KSB1 bacterium]|nr:hypothetical protein [candidate division KSB1 bacterium]MDZ7365797.1 hypothetical protein [candidate division KSB1 bacterium]MDZ7403724.1 hypothetical protein [candidate division KSB1 bacterium]